MEAHGHEKIAQIVGKYLYKLLQDGDNGDFEKSFAQIKGEVKNEAGFIRLLYFGNWITDFTQFFAPDSFRTLREKLTAKNYNELLAATEENILEKVELVTDKLVDNTRAFFLSLIPGFTSLTPILLVAYSYVTQNKRRINRELKEYIHKELQPELNELFEKLKIKSDKNVNFSSGCNDAVCRFMKKYMGSNSREFNYNHTDDKMWFFAEMMVKILGFKKYCLGDDAIPYHELESLLAIIIDKDRNPRDRFNLMLYYPIDHLDRPYRMAELPTKKRYEQYYYADTRLTEQSQGMYEYMKEYREVVAGRFTQIQKDYIANYFTGKVSIPRNEVKKMLIYLGNTLHMVEDFYAHSNFYELSLEFLNGQNLNTRKYHDFSEYLRLDSKNLNVEKIRIDKSGKKTIRKDKINGVAETNLATGYFTIEDTYISLYHLVMSGISARLEKIDVGPLIEKELGFDRNETKSTEAVDVWEALSRFNENITNVMDTYNVETLKKFGVALDNITVKGFDFVTEDYFEKIGISVTEGEKKQAVEVLRIIFVAIKSISAGKSLKSKAEESIQDYKTIYEFIKIIITILTAEAQIGRIIKKVIVKIAAIVLRNMHKSLRTQLYGYLNTFIHEQLENKIHSLGKKVIDSRFEARLGSHSVIAKDEKFEKELAHFQATKMAIFADVFSINNLFLNIQKTEAAVTFPDMKECMTYLMHNPNDGVSRLPIMPQEKTFIGAVNFYSLAGVQQITLNWLWNTYLKFIHREELLKGRTMEYFKHQFLLENPFILKGALDYIEGDLSLGTKSPIMSLFAALTKSEQQIQIERNRTTFSNQDSPDLPKLQVQLPFQKNWKIYHVVTKDKGFTILDEDVQKGYFQPDGQTQLQQVSILSGRSWANYFLRKDFIQFDNSFFAKAQRSITRITSIKELNNQTTLIDYDLFDEDEFSNFVQYIYGKKREEISQISQAELVEYSKETERNEKRIKQQYEVFLRDYLKRE